MFRQKRVTYDDFDANSGCMELATSTWPQVETYLKTKNSLIIPIGSTEQHGPTGIIGTDYVTANGISIAAGKRNHTLVAPPICYGMALHHLGFPGSAALKPSTLLQVVCEIVESFKRHGFKKFLFVNGHGGNIPTLTAAFSELKFDQDRSVLELINWWKLPEVMKYEETHFGNENGFHATVGEVSVTMFQYEEAFKNIPRQNFAVERPKSHWPLGPAEFREVYPDGRMASNPGLATAQHGEALFGLAVDAVVRKLVEMEA